MTRLLTAAALREAAAPLPVAAACSNCEGLRCAGWESASAPAGEPMLQRIGTLLNPEIDEPTLDEHHPDGTHYWHAEAPVAVDYFPYNRCSVWRCRACGRGFVQYTEAGGYYTDHRIREVDPLRVV